MKITKRTTMRSRRAISEIIAMILVIGLTIVAAGILYTYFTSTASRSSNTAQFQVSADLGVPGGTGTGTLAVSITNSGSVAITGITMTQTGLCSVPFNPTPSQNSPLPPGSGTSGTCQTSSSVTAGTSYSFTLTVNFANGQTQTQIVQVTAHS